MVKFKISSKMKIISPSGNITSLHQPLIYIFCFKFHILSSDKALQLYGEQEVSFSLGFQWMCWQSTPFFEVLILCWISISDSKLLFFFLWNIFWLATLFSHINPCISIPVLRTVEKHFQHCCRDCPSFQAMRIIELSEAESCNSKNIS